jgi:hypothetical protein
VETPKDSKYDMVLRDALPRTVWQYIGHYIGLHEYVDCGMWVITWKFKLQLLKSIVEV